MSDARDAAGSMSAQSSWPLSSPRSMRDSSSSGPSTPLAARYSSFGSDSISPSVRSGAHRRDRQRQGQSQRSLLSPLSERSYGSSSSARRAGPHLSPVGLSIGKAKASSLGGSEGESMSERLVRKQFRQRCQEVMARDRQRGRSRAVQAQREGLSSSSPPSSDQFSDDTDNFEGQSDDLLLSMPNEDEEMMRRIMVAEYRKLLRTQEQDGDAQLGWLDPDEVAWLEEEAKREEARGISLEGLEPPPELEDEDEMLAAMYEHACSQQGGESSRSASSHDDSLSMDESDAEFAWVWDADLTIDGPQHDATTHMDMDT